MKLMLLGALALALLPCATSAQTAGSIAAPAGFAPMQAPCSRQADGSCMAIGAGNPMPMASTAAASTTSPQTIVTAGAYQSALAANPARKGCMLVGTSGAALRVYVGAPGAASDAGSIPLVAGQAFYCTLGSIVISDQLSVTSATAGATFAVISQ